MTSPFAFSNQLCTLYLEPILHPFFQSYQEIITLNTKPAGPLGDLVDLLHFPKLSPFQQVGRFATPFPGTVSNCVYVLLRYPKGSISASMKHVDLFMTKEDIPSVLSFLQSNDYSVETALTHMMFDSKVDIGGVSTQRLSGNKKMICMFKYSPPV